MSIIKLEGALMIPSATEPNKMYVEHNGIRYIFEEGKYVGWYRPELGRVL